MPFFSDDKNPLPDLVELKSRISDESGEDGPYRLRTDLGVFTNDVSIEHWTIEVSLRQVTLSMELEGVDVVPGTKHGIDLAPIVSATKLTVETSKNKEVEATVGSKFSAEGSASAFNPKGFVGYTREPGRKEKTTETYKEQSEKSVRHLPVKSVGDNKWRISSSGDMVLDLTYLNNTVLCDLCRKNPNPNRVAIKLEIYATERHIDTKLIKDTRLVGLRPNKEKLLTVLTSKALAEVSGSSPYNGEIVFSVSTVEYEE